MMRAMLAGMMVLVGACASAPGAPGGPPVVTLKPGLPAPPQATLYADCIGQSADTGTYERETGSRTLRFTCTGAVAKVFYDGLQQRSAAEGSEYVAEGRTWRFSNRLIANADGIDNCSTDGAGDYRCHVILNVGPFIEQMDYRLP